MKNCPFCDRIRAADDLRYASDAAVCLADRFPVTEGHLLVVPRRHIARIEELTANEWDGLFGLLHQIARDVASGSDLDGLNVGFNSGAAAGQTVGHAHVHVIPRRNGDVADPRGGIRWVIPERADYWGRRS